MARRIENRYVLLPEPVIEAQIEQRAVHVEEHGVDGGPVDGSGVNHPLIIAQPLGMSDRLT